MSISGVTFSWIDLVILVVLGLGMFRGRSRGMSEELLDMIKWLIIVAVGGMVYRPVGKFVISYAFLSPMASYVLVYLSVIILCRVLFGWFKRLIGEKLVGSDVFGAGEYYLGMLAGAVRFACYIVVAMALLNAQNISPEELAADARLQNENFGDISFPTVGRMQQTVFVGSVSGKFVKRYLERELIVTMASDKSAAPVETLSRQRERAVNEVLGDKK